MDRQAIIDRILDHYERPRHHGPLAGADVVMPGGVPDCGDVITVYLKADRAAGRVAELSFEGKGCSISQGGASLLVEELQGKPFDEVLAMTDADVIALVGAEVAQARPRCATLALHTIQKAIHTYERAQAPAPDEA